MWVVAGDGVVGGDPAGPVVDADMPRHLVGDGGDGLAVGGKGAAWIGVYRLDGVGVPEYMYTG